jgi:hypothetical protein
MAAANPHGRRFSMKSILGSAVFLASLFILRNVLVSSGALTPTMTLIFLAGLVGIPLGGIVFLEGTLEQQRRELQEEIDGLKAQIEELRGEGRGRAD